MVSIQHFKLAAALWCFMSLFGSITSFVNNRPIIGIVTEETKGRTYSSKHGTSSMYASYVKFVESAGGRVVPIMIYQTEDYYKNLLNKINGVLFPGGGVPLNSTGYGRTGRIIYNIALQMNKNNDYFPLWGTCLGFELLSYLTANGMWMKVCPARDLASPLRFTSNFRNSRMFHGISQDLYKVMETENITINYHSWCITPENFTNSGLGRFFKVLSTNQDLRNMTYVSAIEAYNYPFYGVTFHPEKVLFEWALSTTQQNIPHSSMAVKVSQYFANFFINEARKNRHKFPSKQEEDSSLIYNYQPVFTGRLNFTMEQNYYFNVTSTL